MKINKKRILVLGCYLMTCAVGAFAGYGEPTGVHAGGPDDGPFSVDVILTYESMPDAAEARRIRSLGGVVNRSYRHLPMRAVRIPLETLDILAHGEGVKYISPDDSISALSTSAKLTANLPTRATPDSLYNGRGVTVAVIDSGAAAHADLNVRHRVDIVPPPPACSGIFLDRFGRRSWNNDEGTWGWSGAWRPIDETRASDTTYAAIDASKHCASGFCLRLGAGNGDGDTHGDRGVERQVDIAGLGQAALRYDYRRVGGSDGSVVVRVEASDDQGRSWITLARHALDGHDGELQSASIPLERHIDFAQDVRVRFVVAGRYPQAGSRSIHVDNVRIVAGRNAGIDGLACDSLGHGTHIAGAIAGDGRLSHGVHRGIAPGADIVALRALDENGRGKVSDVIAALDWVLGHGTDHGIRVVNLSLGKAVRESAATDPLVLATEAVWDAGYIVVASAGDHGRDGSFTITSPGNSRKVITVGSLTDEETENRSDDYLSTYSSRGPTLFDHVLKPDLIAPGNKLVFPIAAKAKLQRDNPQGIIYDGQGRASYQRLSGTSMAAAVTAGAVALMLDADPTLQPDDVKARLMRSARRIHGDAAATGAGVLDIEAALNETGRVSVPALSPKMALGTATDGSQVVLVEYTAALWGGPQRHDDRLWHHGRQWSDAVQDTDPLFVTQGRRLLLVDD